MKNKPHKHAELIKAWADGAKIETQLPNGKWFEIDTPQWKKDKYRIKPEKDPYKELREAHAAGKTIQIKNFIDAIWVDVSNPTFNQPLNWYRIKPELKLVPFTWEDRDQLRGKWVRIAGSISEYYIVSITRDWIYLPKLGIVSYKELFKEFEFVDNTPCGKYVKDYENN